MNQEKTMGDPAIRPAIIVEKQDTFRETALKRNHMEAVRKLAIIAESLGIWQEIAHHLEVKKVQEEGEEDVDAAEVEEVERAIIVERRDISREIVQRRNRV